MNTGSSQKAIERNLILEASFLSPPDEGDDARYQRTEAEEDELRFGCEEQKAYGGLAAGDSFPALHDYRPEVGIAVNQKRSRFQNLACAKPTFRRKTEANEDRRTVQQTDRPATNEHS